MCHVQFRVASQLAYRVADRLRCHALPFVVLFAVLGCEVSKSPYMLDATGGASATVGAGGQVASSQGGQPSSGGQGGDSSSTFAETGTLAACTFSIHTELAPDMPTVARVRLDVQGLDAEVKSGVIQFGTGTYAMEAPLDLSAPQFETLLLGMKANTEYVYRVGVATGEQYCYSQQLSITSGDLRADVKPLASATVSASKIPGFLVVVQGPRVLILDRDGDVVWGYSLEGATVLASTCVPDAIGVEIFSAKLSYDGRSMLAHDLGPFNCGDGGTFYRIALDGTKLEVIDLPGGDHHDFTVTPQGIAYFGKPLKDAYDQVYVAKSDGSEARLLVDLEPLVLAYPPGGGPGREKSHVNMIHYWRDRDIYTLSNRESDAIFVVNGAGEIVSGIGKPADASFETIVAESTEGGGGPLLWRVQHGHDLYQPDKLLVFSNGDFIGGQAYALHYTIADDGMARLDWSYDKMGNSGTQGDIQMLPQGHVLICASDAGVIHELDNQLNLVAKYQAPERGFGYVMHRTSLYGPPPDGR